MLESKLLHDTHIYSISITPHPIFPTNSSLLQINALSPLGPKNSRLTLSKKRRVRMIVLAAVPRPAATLIPALAAIAQWCGLPSLVRINQHAVGYVVQTHTAPTIVPALSSACKGTGPAWQTARVSMNARNSASLIPCCRRAGLYARTKGRRAERRLEAETLGMTTGFWRE